MISGAFGGDERVLPRVTQARHSRSGRRGHVSEMKDLRELFPITEQVSYLNTATTGALSRPVSEAVKDCLDSRMSHGQCFDGEWADRLVSVRRKVARLIGATPDEVAVVNSTVEGLSMVAGGIHWHQGDNVVANSLEFPGNIYPWMSLKDRFGVDLRIAPAKDGRVILSDLFSAVDDRTRVVSVSFVEFSNGFKNDLKAIGSFCRERGIYFVVDAIQGLGVIPLDVRESKIDFLAAAAFKWLLGPLGIGCFYCRKELLDDVWLIRPGYDSVVGTYDEHGDLVELDYNYVLRPNAERFEGTSHSFLGVYGFDAALDLIEEAGVSNIHSHTLTLIDMLVSGLQEKGGYRILSSLKPGERSSIISLAHSDLESREIVQRLADAGVIVALREGAVRVSPHFYNNEADIERLLANLP